MIMMSQNNILIALLTSTRLATITFVSMLIASSLNGVHAQSSLCEGSTLEPCSAGCWNARGTLLDGFRNCVPVGKGYASAQGSDKRQACQAGFFSDQENAESCRACPVGHFSPIEVVAAEQCSPCPVGSFQEATGMTTCEACLTDYYSGMGSDFAITDESSNTNELYCIPPLHPPGTSKEPTRSPTTSPSMMERVPTPTMAPAFPPALTTKAPANGIALPTLAPSRFGGPQPGDKKLISKNNRLYLPIVAAGCILSSFVVLSLAAWQYVQRRKRRRNIKGDQAPSKSSNIKTSQQDQIAATFSADHDDDGSLEDINLALENRMERGGMSQNDDDYDDFDDDDDVDLTRYTYGRRDDEYEDAPSIAYAGSVWSLPAATVGGSMMAHDEDEEEDDDGSSSQVY